MHSSGNQFMRISFIVMIAACYLAGCGPGLFSYKGDKVTRKDLMVLLQEGNQHGEWKTNELAIKYQYQLRSQTLKFSGTIEQIGGYSYFSRLAVNLLILDNQGIVIENKLIYVSGNYRHLVTIPKDFDTTISIPEGARTISFVYDLSPVHRN